MRDDTALNPQSSYGTQKAIAELLLADYTRRGFVDGRVLRLPTISVRPGKPNAAASSFASGMIREPLNGEDAVCPVRPGTRLWLLSPRGAIAALVAGCELDAARLDSRAPINLPGVCVTAQDMARALREVAGDTVADRIHWEPDARVERIVGSWPGRWDTSRPNGWGCRATAASPTSSGPTSTTTCRAERARPPVIATHRRHSLHTMNSTTSSSTLTGRRVGVVGLGAMGSGIARSLRRAGLTVHVYDVRAEAAAAFAAEGGVACATLAEMARACDVIVSVVVNAQQTEAVLFGDGGLAGELQPGSVFVMCSTVDPNWSVALEARLQALGLHYLDAPISGGAAAAAGQMTMMTAGSAAAYAACEGVLEAMAGKVYRLGDRAGAGSKVKIINQLLAGVHIAAAAEAMALGLREGVDADALYEVITHSAGNSWMFENRMAHVLAGDYAPLSAVDIFVRIWGWCWTRPVTANSRCRWRPPRTRCSCKRPPPAMAARTTARSSRSSRHPSAGGEMSIKLGCIADDFTGATDLANNLVRAGMRAVQTIGVPGGALRADADAVVVALKTRSLPADEAVAQSLAALAWLRAQGAEQIYFKYCSTFDSTPQGNIGPVTDALMARLGTDFTIATPAFPDNRRTVFKGYLFVGDVLLNESGMQHHPLTPMTDPNLLRVLAAQTRRKVGLIDHAVVARGSAAIRERIAALRAEGVEIAIVDAVSNDDLLALGPALKGMPW